jgi:hypothetical protein
MLSTTPDHFKPPRYDSKLIILFCLILIMVQNLGYIKELKEIG